MKPGPKCNSMCNNFCIWCTKGRPEFCVICPVSIVIIMSNLGHNLCDLGEFYESEVCLSPAVTVADCAQPETSYWTTG